MELIRMGPEDACKLWDMQVEAFWGLYQTYRDTETSPATETVEKVRAPETALNLLLLHPGKRRGCGSGAGGRQRGEPYP